MRQGLCLFFLIFFTSCALHHSETCVATVVHPGGNGKPCIIEFRASGKRQVHYGPRQRLLTKGERFHLVYNTRKPWKHQLLTESPLFLQNETTHYTGGKVIRCVSGNYSKVIFSYEVDGKRYKKLQMIKGQVDLSSDDQCLVRFSPNNPSRSILVAKQNFSCLSSLTLTYGLKD